jgi:hypothetical protein
MSEHAEDKVASRLDGPDHGKPEVHLKQEAIRVDHNVEHALTVKQVFKNHPAVVWWCFFWAMAAVGW